MAPLRLVRDSLPADPPLDIAVSRALLERVAAGELPATLRIARPGAMVAFAKQDAVSRGYEAAVEAARGQGFEAVLRLAGGRAAVFHEETVALAHAIPVLVLLAADVASPREARSRESAQHETPLGAPA